MPVELPNSFWGVTGMNARRGQYWPFIVIALGAACNLKPRDGLGVDNPVTQVLVAPAALTIDPLQSFQFQAYGRTQAGDSVPIAVDWQASAGTISQAGVYTADTSASDVTVTATLSSTTSVSGTARVTKR
ncbi:MAG TPA: hypothetical protein VIV83_02065, partial [Gemmatimonadales bacterium]